MDNTNRKDNPTNRSLVTISEVQDYLNTTDITITGSLNNIIMEVSAEFEKYCNTGIKSNEYSSSYDGTGNNILYTKNIPIISVSKLQYRNIDGTYTDFYTDTELPNYLYINNQSIGFFNNTFPIGKNNIYIEYKAGFDTIPSDIKRVSLERVAEIFKKGYKGDGTLLIKTNNISGGAGSYGITYDDISPRIYSILDKYKNIGI